MERNDLKPGLFERFTESESNAAELRQLFSYFGRADQKELQDLIQSEFENGAVSFNQADTNRLNGIHAELSKRIFVKPAPPALRLLKSKRVIRIAAAILVIASLSILMVEFLNSGSKILPGSSKAEISLNGVVRKLEGKKAELIYQNGGVIVKTNTDGSIVYTALGADSVTSSQLNSLVTPKGGMYRIVLGDGSVVMLNAGSKLTFPMGFPGHQRRVYLEGEAFFNVTKDASKPFIVEVARNEIKVLGTQFNVSSYLEDEGTQATLLEGSIKFSNSSGAHAILTPNQQVTTKGAKLNVQNVSAEDFNAWTKGLFLFNDVPLKTVMQKLGRWYNVDVDAESIPQKSLYLKISRNADIDEVIEMISEATGYRFKIKENRIVLKI